jgi:membrane-bound lytic murein transglycosylase A
MRQLRRFSVLSLMLCLTSCAWFKPSDHFETHPVALEELSGWQDDNFSDALETFTESCPVLTDKARGPSQGSGLQVSQDVWRSLCNEARQIPAHNQERAQQFFEQRFIPYRVTNNHREQGLFTGYYEPVLYGSLKKKGFFTYPLYRAPADLERKKPYLTHAEINHGGLDGQRLELLWVDDPVMLFFLQIQGSGRVRMPHGKEILVGYAGGNGQPYQSLGKIMGDEGLIPKDQINFFTLRQWLYDHHDQALEMMERNPSYVFFRLLDAREAIGAAGAPLTPQRSLAVDNRYIPYGLPLFLETDLPPTPYTPVSPYHRLMIAQDTGGAIKGPVRGDIFFGPGEGAEYMAGYMKGKGVYTLLVPKEIAYQLQPNP